jgi:Leucine-rich repeat (LRR) protein
MPAEAVPALTIYPEEVQTSLSKSRVPHLVTDPGDVALLKKLRHQNDPDGRLKWFGSEDLSGEGLEADPEGRLSRLTLEPLGLTGDLDISGADALTEFKSEGNPFASLTISGLSRLLSLTLTGGGLTRLQGSWPARPPLVSLDLRHNQIETLAGLALPALTALETLNLSRNRLAEIKPGLLAPLKTLVSLQLSDNRLTEIGEGLFNGLTRLEILDLGHNRLTRLAPAALAGLKALKLLDLSGNHLARFPVAALAGLENLTVVELQNNCLPLKAMKTVLGALPEGVNLSLRDQQYVYFGLRVQLLSKLDRFDVPPEDALIGEVASDGRVLGDDPGGAAYAPPEKAGQPGRLTFQRPGLYRLTLTSGELSRIAGASSTTGYFLIVEGVTAEPETLKRPGNRELVRELTSRGYVEAPAADPGRVRALQALFSPGPERSDD